jgi:hypothetical protein
MALLADLLSRVRLEIGDQQKQFTFTATGDGTTKDFYLNVKPVELTNLYVTVGGTAIAYPAGYTLEANVGMIHFITAPANNAAIRVTGTANRYFLDSELTTFINTAVTQHTNNRTDSFGSLINLAAIPPVEEYPLAILASIEGLWALATDAAFDINITAPDGVVIPRAQRFQQLTAIITQRMEQYKQLCAALNIGLWRLEIGTLRRVSRHTNKLVPIYLAQEIDDGRKPERIYMQNDLLGRTPLPNYAGTYDIQLYQGDNWSQLFTFPFDVTNLTFKAQIRTYPNAPVAYATFTITKTDPTNGVIQLSLTPSETKYFPVRAFWDLQATDTSNPNFEQTYIKGQVFTAQQVTLD